MDTDRDLFLSYHDAARPKIEVIRTILEEIGIAALLQLRGRPSRQCIV